MYGSVVICAHPSAEYDAFKWSNILFGAMLWIGVKQDGRILCCNTVLITFPLLSSLLQVKDVRNHKLDNRMESFFLSETTKYLYLLFDRDSFLHNTGNHGDVIKTPHGECVLNAGGYIFNTEAHPIDVAALDCCHRAKDVDVLENVIRTLHGRRDKFDFVLDYLETQAVDWGSEGLSESSNCSVKPYSSRWSLMGEMLEP